MHTHKRSKSEANAPLWSRQIETFRLSLKLTLLGSGNRLAAPIKRLS